MRLAHDAIPGNLECAEAAAAIAPAIGHVRVDAEIVPRRGERVPGIDGLREQGAHWLRTDRRKAGLLYACGDGSKG